MIRETHVSLRTGTDHGVLTNRSLQDPIRPVVLRALDLYSTIAEMGACKSS